MRLRWLARRQDLQEEAYAKHLPKKEPRPCAGFRSRIIQAGGAALWGGPAEGKRVHVPPNGSSSRRLNQLAMFRRITVFEHEQALHFKSGRFVGVLNAGYHWFFGLRHSFESFDLRPTFVVTGGQETMTRDGAPLKISLAMEGRVVDVRTHQRSMGALEPHPFRPGPLERLVPVTQAALRDWSSKRTLDEALEAREALTTETLPVIAQAAERHGLGDLSLFLLEFAVAGNVRAAFNDLLRAELEGRAAMTRARNEAATMRSLMNTARLVREHPGLLELRVLTSGQRPRVQFTVGPPTTAAPDDGA